MTKGVHHYYIGEVLTILGMIYGNWPLFIIGLLIRFDDFWQHLNQIDNRDYRSFLSRLYEKTLWKIPIIQKLNAWVDKIFGA